MRPLIQYDLDEHPTTQSAPVPTGPNSNALRPPSKKRKRNHRSPQKFPSDPTKKVLVQHWDDPGSTAVGVAYDEDGSAPVGTRSATTSSAEAVEEVEGYDEEAEQGNEGAGEDEEEEESRLLTHEEIWDDTALIDAWNSAEAEYEAYHGTSKAWKTEAVKKSPLWYNKPPAPQPGPGKHKPGPKHDLPPLPRVQQEADGDTETDTAPLDFDTYVPTHDPSLAIPSVNDADTSVRPAATAPFFVPPPSTTMVGRDEAFDNALNAMYWSGFWTAVYHCQSQGSGRNNISPEEATEGGIEADGDEDEEDLVPAQR